MNRFVQGIKIRRGGMMFYDEMLIQKEMAEKRKNESEDRIEKIREDIIRQEREQKAVDDYVSELEAGSVDIAGRAYVCEKRKVLEGAASVCVFPEDIWQISQERTAMNVIFGQLEAACSIQYVPMRTDIMDEKAYHDRVAQKMRQAGILYQPVKEGNLLSGKRKIRYICGITSGSVGGVYVVNYYFPAEEGIVAGSFSCKLSDRFTFDHLFLAMLCLMCVVQEG